MKVLSLREHRGLLDLEADVVVVGSGASGAVIARELAEAGQSVLVVEEGAQVTPERLGAFRPSETLRHVARCGGAQVAFGIGDTPTINVLTGRAVGGSSLMTGGVCFRIPEEVLWSWGRELGLPEMEPSRFEEAYARVERTLNVHEVPVALRSRATTLFAEGAAKRGLELHPVRRNTSGCVGHGRCNFGCPAHAKLSVDRSYLPLAVEKGARIVSDCRIDRITVVDGRAAGVVGRSSEGELRVRAKTVVLCAGTLHTPQLLARSGLGRRSKQLGRNVTLHPGFRVGGFFDQPVEGWKGALQSLYSDTLRDEGLTFVGLWAPINLLAATLPGHGAVHDEWVRRLSKLALFGGMVHDEGGGRLRRGPGREPLLFYRLAARDKARMILGMKVLGECYFEAGARQVLLPILGMGAVGSPDELKRRLEGKVPARAFECIAFHPLGSARMGRDAASGCVDHRGQAFELPGLYIADGSILPTSIGVNTQLPIMAMATRIAWGIRDR